MNIIQDQDFHTLKGKTHGQELLTDFKLLARGSGRLEGCCSGYEREPSITIG
jgi:hypothetical protein